MRRKQREESEERLYEEYVRKEDLMNFLAALDWAKILLGLVEVRISQSSGRTRVNTPRAVGHGTQPLRVKLLQLSVERELEHGHNERRDSRIDRYKGSSL